MGNPKGHRRNFVDDKPDFDRYYITIEDFKGNVLQNVAIQGVFVDDKPDFDRCYITIEDFKGNVLWILQNAVKRRNYLANHFRLLLLPSVALQKS